MDTVLTIHEAAPFAVTGAQDAPKLARRAAQTNCALLITGDTGTGKGHLARWIHQHSPRAHGPFVPVNCGAIPENLVDSHLFGHAKGSFSGANADHLGLVRAANGGTLLLDEISELPMNAQLRLLRLLEEREVQPVGHSKPMIVDVRIIAASNTDLQQRVERGSLRQDLFFRLDVVRLHLKPLCQRLNELPQLLEQFNGEFAELYRQPQLKFDRQALGYLHHHRWPGNIRELRTVVERLHVLCGVQGQEITVDDLRRFGQIHNDPPAHWPAMQRIQDVKLSAVSSVIDQCHGNVSRAATTLGVHRSTIYRWLAQRTTPV